MNRLLMLVALCTLLSLASCKNASEKKEEAAKLLVTRPLKLDTAIVNDYVCQIRSIKHIELRAQERGYLEKCFVDEGQFVKQGQLLFKIMPRLNTAEMEKARAEANFTEIEYQNTKKLADSNVVSASELALAKAKLNKARAELSLMQTHLQFTEIRAPFDGIVGHLMLRPGSLVEDGDMLTTLADNSKMWVYFNVPEAEYLDYKSKEGTGMMQVNLLMANHEMFAYPGLVETIEADFDNETGNIPFRATFPNPKGLLRHGETGNIKMQVPLKNAIVIPQKATFEVLDKKYVYVVGQDNVVRSKEIAVGAEMRDLYVVNSGLAEQDKILLEGLRKVKDNDKIRYNYEEPQSVISKLELPAE